LLSSESAGIIENIDAVNSGTGTPLPLLPPGGGGIDDGILPLLPLVSENESITARPAGLTGNGGRERGGSFSSGRSGSMWQYFSPWGHLYTDDNDDELLEEMESTAGLSPFPW
jgi:hypothetical protein